MAFPLLIVPALLLLFGKNPNENPRASIAVGEKMPVKKLPPTVNATDLAKIPSTQTLAAQKNVSGTALKIDTFAPVKSVAPPIGDPVPPPRPFITALDPDLQRIQDELDAKTRALFTGPGSTPGNIADISKLLPPVNAPVLEKKI